MFKCTCIRCGGDCDKVAYFLEIRVVQNYATSPKDVGDPVGKVNARGQVAYCQKCYGELDLPNIYELTKG